MTRVICANPPSWRTRDSLEAARQAWIQAAVDDPAEYAHREGSDFLTYTDHRGRVADTHAQRKTYISNVGRTGADLRTVQELAGHRSPTTAARYMGSFRRDQAAAVSKLPSVAPRPAVATGTDDHLGRYLGRDRALRGTSVDGKRHRNTPEVTSSPSASKAHPPSNTSFTEENGEGGIRTLGAENTPHDGLANRCLQPGEPGGRPPDCPVASLLGSSVYAGPPGRI